MDLELLYSAFINYQITFIEGSQAKKMTVLLLLCLILCDSPIVPLNNWKLRTCLFYFLLGQHLPILVFFSPQDQLPW